jgi:cytoskeletal protein CcmA (bactofilin family)
MSDEYPHDVIDGQEVPSMVVNSDHVLSGTHDGSVQVEAGYFELRGRLRGSLHLHTGATASISGVQAGSISLESGVSVRVTGAIDGSTFVDQGSTLVVEAGARLAGSLHNEGRVIVRGVFGGAQSGSGELRLEGHGCVKQPVVRDGAHYYEW